MEHKTTVIQVGSKRIYWRFNYSISDAIKSRIAKFLAFSFKLHASISQILTRYFRPYFGFYSMDRTIDNFNKTIFSPHTMLFTGSNRWRVNWMNFINWWEFSLNRRKMLGARNGNKSIQTYFLELDLCLVENLRWNWPKFFLSKLVKTYQEIEKWKKSTIFEKKLNLTKNLHFSSHFF